MLRLDGVKVRVVGLFCYNDDVWKVLHGKGKPHTAFPGSENDAQKLLVLLSMLTMPASAYMHSATQRDVALASSCAGK